MSVNYIRRKEKEKETKKRNIINTVFIVIIVALIGALAVMVSNDTKNIKIEEKIKELTYDEYADVINDDKYSIILLTASDCGHCKNYKPYVNYAANEYDLNVYDVDVSSKDLTKDQYLKLHSYSALKDSYNNGNAVIPTPTTVIVKNGEEVSSVIGNIGYDGFIDFLVQNKFITKK